MIRNDPIPKKIIPTLTQLADVKKIKKNNSLFFNLEGRRPGLESSNLFTALKTMVPKLKYLIVYKPLKLTIDI